MKITRKELDKRITAVLKVLVKETDFKKRDCILFKKKQEYFISIMVSATGVDNNLINVSCKVKPYFMDDIFWDVFLMPGNSNQPMGLRANGAFATRGPQIYEESIEIDNYDNVEEYVRILFEKSRKISDTVIDTFGNDFWKFIEFSKGVEKKGLYDLSLAIMLLYIEEGKFREAKEFSLNEMGNRRYGHFENKGKDIYEYIVDYCEKKLEGKVCQ